MENYQAFYNTSFIMAAKSFIVQAPAYLTGAGVTRKMFYDIDTRGTLEVPPTVKPAPKTKNSCFYQFPLNLKILCDFFLCICQINFIPKLENALNI